MSPLHALVSCDQLLGCTKLEKEGLEDGRVITRGSVGWLVG